MRNCGDMPALYVRYILWSGVIPIRFINIDVALPTSFLIFKNINFPIKCYLPAKFQLFVIFFKKSASYAGILHTDVLFLWLDKDKEMN